MEPQDLQDHKPAGVVNLGKAELDSAMKAAGTRDRQAWIAALIGVLVLPLILGDGFYLSLMNFIALYSMVALGLCLLLGYGGQLSISHAAFYAIGAYSSGIFCLRGGLHPLLAIVLSQFLSALIAWGIGTVVLRLKGHYLAIATLSFAMIVEVLLRELPGLTGALQGLSGIPEISVGGFTFDTDMRFYYLVWPVAMVLLLFALNLVNSRMGRIFRAIREGEGIAALFGANVRRYKVKLFIVSSVYASIAGSLFAHYVTYISPAAGSVMFAIEIILVIAIGGYTMIWGAVLGVAAITYLNEYLSLFAEYKRTIYGVSLIVIMIFFPHGLLEGLKTSAARLVQSLQKGASG